MCQQDWEGAQRDKGQKETRREAVPEQNDSGRVGWVPQPNSISSAGYSCLRGTTTYYVIGFITTPLTEMHGKILINIHSFPRQIRSLTKQPPCASHCKRLSYGGRLSPLSPLSVRCWTVLAPALSPDTHCVITGQPHYLSVLGRCQKDLLAETVTNLQNVFSLLSRYTCTQHTEAAGPRASLQQVSLQHVSNESLSPESCWSALNRRAK